MNPLLAYVALTFYECVLTALDEDMDSMVEGAIALHTSAGPAEFDEVLKKARLHLAILSVAKRQKQEEGKDESVSASQEESPVAGRDHKE